MAGHTQVETEMPWRPVPMSTISSNQVKKRLEKRFAVRPLDFTIETPG